MGDRQHSSIPPPGKGGVRKMATKMKSREIAMECWHTIQKSYDHIQNGLTLLEHAEIHMESLMRDEDGAEPEPDRLGFGKPAQQQDPDSGE